MVAAGHGWSLLNVVPDVVPDVWAVAWWPVAARCPPTGSSGPHCGSVHSHRTRLSTWCRLSIETETPVVSVVESEAWRRALDSRHGCDHPTPRMSNLPSTWSSTCRPQSQPKCRHPPVDNQLDHTAKTCNGACTIPGCHSGSVTLGEGGTGPPATGDSPVANPVRGVDTQRPTGGAVGGALARLHYPCTNAASVDARDLITGKEQHVIVWRITERRT